MKQVIQKLSIPDTNIESLQERRFWLQCERAYTATYLPCSWATNGC